MKPIKQPVVSEECQVCPHGNRETTSKKRPLQPHLAGKDTKAQLVQRGMTAFVVTLQHMFSGNLSVFFRTIHLHFLSAASFLTNDLWWGTDGDPHTSSASSLQLMFARKEEIIRFLNVPLGSECDFSRPGTGRRPALPLRMTDGRSHQTEASAGDRDPFLLPASAAKSQTNDVPSSR